MGTKLHRQLRADLHQRASSLQTYLVCSTHRTGTTLLCQLLTDTGLCGYPEEYFSPRWAPRFAEELATGEVARQDGVSAPEGPPDGSLFEQLELGTYLQGLFDAKATANGLWGSKLHWPHVRRLHDAFKPRRKLLRGGRSTHRLLEEIFAAPRYIWIRRRDKVKQAISFWRSMQTRIYNTASDDVVEAAQPEFDYTQIHEIVQRFEKHDEGWERLFRTGKVQPLVVEFESFVKSMESTVQGVLDYLDIETPAGFTAPVPRLKKISNELNENWYRRYHEIQAGGQ
jgi:LPS sulfotransferase NodH